jgi:DNA-binding XRE family transcriptional regulator
MQDARSASVQFAYAGRTKKGRSKTREAIAEIRHPIRRNDLEARRRRLKLSRVALARILNVDPATVYRQERGVMSALWDYAMRGIEAEAAMAGSKSALRGHQARVDSRDLVADGVIEHGHRYTGEKMKQQKPRPRLIKAPPPPEPLGVYRHARLLWLRLIGQKRGQRPGSWRARSPWPPSEITVDRIALNRGVRIGRRRFSMRGRLNIARCLEVLTVTTANAADDRASANAVLRDCKQPETTPGYGRRKTLS